MRAEIQILGDLSEGEGVDDALAEIGEQALGQLVELAVGEVGDHPPEHGVTEELEPLVALDSLRLRAP